MTLGVSRSCCALLFAATCLPTATATGTAVPRPPMTLPGAAAGAASGARWLVGARPGGATLRIARAHGARALDPRGASLDVPRGRARALVTALRRAGRLAYAEPDVAVTPAGIDDDPRAWSRAAIVAPSAIAPSPARAAPVAVIDLPVDATVPDLAGHVTFLGGQPNGAGFHGTAVASVISGARNGSGVLGIVPGERILAYALPLQKITCTDVVRGIEAAVARRARVMNLSLSTGRPCYSMFAALERAFSRDVLAVAAVGNGGRLGDPVTWPAGFPHVIGVGAVQLDFAAAPFSSANATVDLTAPGTGVPVAMPMAFDLDGEPDGVSLGSGTSYSAPAVTGVAGWVRTLRPGLRAAQVAGLLRASAIDLGRPGWNRDTGLGLVNIARALRFPAPSFEPREPDDDIPLVDGTALGRPARTLWHGGGGRYVRATVDQLDDPIDAYRLRLPARAAVELSLSPDQGNADLDVYDGGARRIGEVGHLLGVSRQPGARTDRVRIINRTPRTVTAYAVVRVSRAIRGVSAPYRLTVQPNRDTR